MYCSNVYGMYFDSNFFLGELRIRRALRDQRVVIVALERLRFFFRADAEIAVLDRVENHLVQAEHEIVAGPGAQAGVDANQ